MNTIKDLKNNTSITIISNIQKIVGGGGGLRGIIVTKADEDNGGN